MKKKQQAPDDRATRKSLGRILWARKDHVGVGERELARQAGMARSSVRRLLEGEVDNPTFENLNRLSNAQGLDIVLTPRPEPPQAA